MQREFKENLRYIAEKRREARAETAAKREAKLRDKITKTLALDGDARTLPTRMTLASFAKFREQARSKSAIVKEVKLNINCLKMFYGHKHRDLIAYSAAGVLSLSSFTILYSQHCIMSRRQHRNDFFSRQYHRTV